MRLHFGFATKRLLIDSKEEVFRIWEIMGQRRFNSLKEMHYLGSVCFLFDLNNPDTLDSLPSSLAEAVENNHNRIVPMMLIDLQAGEWRQVPLMTEQYNMLKHSPTEVGRIYHT